MVHATIYVVDRAYMQFECSLLEIESFKEEFHELLSAFVGKCIDVVFEFAGFGSVTEDSIP